MSERRRVPSGSSRPGVAGRRSPSARRPASVFAPASSSRRRTTSAIAAPSIATSVPPRIVDPRSTAARTTGVAAVDARQGPQRGAQRPRRDVAARTGRHAGCRTRPSRPPGRPGSGSRSRRGRTRTSPARPRGSAAARPGCTGAGGARSGGRGARRSGRASGRGPARRARPAGARCGSRAPRPPISPIAGAATSSGSTPSVPRAVRVSVAPYSRSWSIAITASATSARSSPRRWGSVRPPWRPIAARTPAMLTPDSSVGIVRATSATMPPMTADRRTSRARAAARSGRRPRSPGSGRRPATSSIASHGAASVAGTTTSSASPNAIATRWPVPAPRERSSAVSVRRRSSSSAATRMTA